MRNPSNLAILEKAEEIFELVRTITDLIPEDNEHLQSYKGQILGDAMMICVKISSAEAVKLYDLKMENAAIIRKAARDLTQITQLKFFEISLWGNPKFRRTIFCVFW